MTVLSLPRSFLPSEEAALDQTETTLADLSLGSFTGLLCYIYVMQNSH